jgi:hypothetical protein
MRKITFAVYNPPKEGLPYLSTVIAPTGAVAAVAYQTAAEAEDHNLKKRPAVARIARPLTARKPDPHQRLSQARRSAFLKLR